jgi:hypothetical protein
MDWVQGGALGLLGVLLLGLLPIVRKVAEALLDNLKGISATQKDLAANITANTELLRARIDVVERSVQDNIDETRHTLKSDLTEVAARIEARIERTRMRPTPGE